MTRRKINPDSEPALITSEKSSIEYGGHGVSLMIQQIKDLPLYSGKTGIISRAEQSWILLTADEKNEYSRKAFSMPYNGFDLFICDYISLSGSELEGSMKTLLQSLITIH